MKKLTMNRDKKLRLICFAIILALCVTMIPIMSMANEESYVPQDVTDKVTFSNLRMEYGKKPVTEETKLTVGNEVNIYVDWSVGEDKISDINTSDFFRVKLPNIVKYYQVKEGSKIKVINEEDGLLIGYYTILLDETTEEYYMTFSFDGDMTLFKKIEDGFLSMRGKIADVQGEDQELVFDSLSLPKVTIGTSSSGSGGSSASEPKPFTWTKPKTENSEFKKTGGNRSGDMGLIYWSLYVGYDALQAKLADPTTTVAIKENAFIIDELPKGVSFEKKITSIEVPLYMYDENGNLTGNSLRTVSVKTSYKVQKEGDTFSTFKATIKEGGPGSYGYFTDSEGIQTLIFYLGNYPGDLKTYYTSKNYTLNRLKERVGTKIAELERDNNFTDKEAQEKAKVHTINKWTQIYNNPGGDDPLPVLGFRIIFDTRVSSEAQLTGTNQISNTAKMIWETNQSIEKGFSFTVNTLAAGARSISKNSFKLTKLDQETKEPLEGVSFRLDKLDANGNVISSTEEKSTDKDGIVQFDKLSNGKYEIVETGGLNGYKKPLSLYDGDIPQDDNTFTITDELTEGLQYTGYNHRIYGTVDIAKYDIADMDKENKTNPLEDVEFQLLYWDEDLDGWTNYMTENEYGEKEIVKKVTDDKGKTQFSNLPWGKYKLVETRAAENYDEQLYLEEDVVDEFVIGNGEGQLLEVNYDAYNDSTPIEEEGSVKGDISYDAQGDPLPTIVKVEEGSVLGEEAKTGDVSNLMPIMILIVVVMAIMLIATLQAYRKED